jgi:2-polyprenyl-3-methyl-5-hydroxy-6-metoxy-1,4-benzoquinol methylase
MVENGSFDIDGSDLIRDWIHKIRPGRALDLGSGDGEQSLWLARQGFHVDAVENQAQCWKYYKRYTPQDDVHLFRLDLIEFEYHRAHYDLVLASAVLHFLRPSILPEITQKLIQTLAPGGYLVAEVFTLDDPGKHALDMAGEAEVEPNTFPIDAHPGVIHFFSPGELERWFSTLQILEYDEFRRSAPHSSYGYRSGASLVARREL